MQSNGRNSLSILCPDGKYFVPLRTKIIDMDLSYIFDELSREEQQMLIEDIAAIAIRAALDHLATMTDAEKQAVMQSAMGNRLMPASVVCKHLGISRSTLGRWVKAGRLPMHKIGGRCFIDSADIGMATQRHKHQVKPITQPKVAPATLPSGQSFIITHRSNQYQDDW